MRLRHVMRVSILFASLILATSAEAAVRAWLDDGGVSGDGTIELNLEHDGQTSAEPDLSPLKQDFDVLGSSRSSSIRIVNGSATSSVRIALSLSPKRSGPLTIPALTWGNETSDPILIKSGASSGKSGNSDAAGAGAAQVFLKTSIQPQRSYVQAGVDLTVRLYAAVPLSHGNLELPANNDVVVQQVGTDRNETVVENGRRYQVVERHYELFPQRSGSLTLAGPVLDARIAVQDRNDVFGDAFQGLFGNSPMNAFTSTKPIRVRADDITLSVLPRPASANGSYWLPARHLALEAQWHPDHGQPKAGDPVTLDLHLEAQGLTAAQLPDLSTLLKLPDGVKAYPDQATLKNEADGASLKGIRDQSIALIADRAGEFTVPALTVHWWDTNADLEREAVVPAHTLTFSPGVQPAVTSPPIMAPALPAASQPEARGADAASAPTQAAPAPQRWFWLSVIFAVLWLLTVVAWYVSRRVNRRRPVRAEPVEEERRGSAAEARRQFHDACRRDDARAARASLREWLRVSSPGQPPVSLQSFARDAADENLKGLLLELDRACFCRTPWAGSKLSDALQTLPAKRGKRPGQAEELMSLYK